MYYYVMKVNIPLLLALNFFGCCGQKSNSTNISSIKSIRIEYIGESDKASPVVWIGLDSPKQLKFYERFYRVDINFLNTIFEGCFESIAPDNKNEPELLRVEVFYIHSSNSKILNEHGARRFLNCAIIYSKEQRGISFALDRVMKNLSFKE